MRRMNVALNGKLLKEVECFEYFGSRVLVEGGIDRKVKFKINAIEQRCVEE